MVTVMTSTRNGSLETKQNQNIIIGDNFDGIKRLKADTRWETKGICCRYCSYVIRLKENGILRGKASYLVDELDEITRNNKVDYAVVYGEFMYKAKSWPYERRVVCKVEKSENQMVSIAIRLFA